MKSRNIWKMGALALLSLGAAVEARIIMVHAPAGSVGLEAMRELALAVNSAGTQVTQPWEGTPAYKVTEDSRLTSEMEVPEGHSAYYWSDAPIQIDAGYRPSGVSTVFENTTERTSLPKPATLENTGTHATSMTEAQLGDRHLHVGYSLAAAGRVELELLDARGRRLAAWRWRDGAGSHVKDLDIVGGIPHAGQVFLRWNLDGKRAVERLTYRAMR